MPRIRRRGPPHTVISTLPVTMPRVQHASTRPSTAGVASFSTSGVTSTSARPRVRLMTEKKPISVSSPRLAKM